MAWYRDKTIMQLIGLGESGTLGSRVRRQICLVKVRIVSAYGRFTLSRYSYSLPSVSSLGLLEASSLLFFLFYTLTSFHYDHNAFSSFGCDWRYLL